MRKRKTFKDVFGNELGVGDWVLVCDPARQRSEYHLAFISRLSQVRLYSPRINPYDILNSWEDIYYQCCAIKYFKNTIPKTLEREYLNILSSSTYHTYCLKNNITELPFKLENV